MFLGDATEYSSPFCIERKNIPYKRFAWPLFYAKFRDGNSTNFISFSLDISLHINPIFQRLVGGFQFYKKNSFIQTSPNWPFYALDMLYVPTISQKSCKGKHMSWIPRQQHNSGPTVVPSNPTPASTLALCQVCADRESRTFPACLRSPSHLQKSSTVL